MLCTLIELRLKPFGETAPAPVRISNAPFDVVFNGNVYTAAGDALKIESTEDTSEVSKTGVSVTLSGLNVNFQNEISNGGFVRAPIDIIKADVPDGSNVVATYAYYHRGYCDTPLMEVDYDSNTLTIGVETSNIFVDLDKEPSLLKCNMASHSSRHVGDKFFEFTADVDLEEIWKD